MRHDKLVEIRSRSFWISVERIIRIVVFTKDLSKWRSFFLFHIGNTRYKVKHVKLIVLLQTLDLGNLSDLMFDDRGVIKVISVAIYNFIGKHGWLRLRIYSLRERKCVRCVLQLQNQFFSSSSLFSFRNYLSTEKREINNLTIINNFMNVYDRFRINES